MHQRLPSLVAAVPSASLGDCWNYWNWTLPVELVLELLKLVVHHLGNLVELNIAPTKNKLGKKLLHTSKLMSLYISFFCAGFLPQRNPEEARMVN